MRELKAHLVRGADDRVRSGRDGKHFFFCVCFAGLKVRIFICFCVLFLFFFFGERSMADNILYNTALNTR